MSDATAEAQPARSACEQLEQASPSSSPRACSPCIPVDDLAEHVTCNLCAGPVAASLVLTCSHIFCGACLLKRLQAEGMGATKQSCPTCSIDLRAVPVRCAAMDRVAAAVARTLLVDAQQAYARRVKDGATAANQVNKMLWFVGNGSGGAGVLPPASGGLLAAPPAGGFHPGLGGALPGAAVSSPALLAPCGAGAFGVPGVAPFAGLVPGAAGAAPLLQLAVAAQQLASAQQAAKAQQLAAAFGAPGQHAGHGAEPLAGLPHVPLFGGAHAAVGAELGCPPGLPSPPGPFGHPHHLGSLMASMCQV